MATTLTELVDSREIESGQRPSVTFHYSLEGTADENAAKDQAEDSTPRSYRGLRRSAVVCEPVWVDEDADEGQWNVSVEYIAPQYTPAETGESSFTFDTGGGTVHATQSIATSGKYPAGSAPDFKGAIGVTDTSVEGVDLLVPSYNFGETHYIPQQVVTDAYKAKLFALTGRVNSAAFRGLARGECLFRGASGSQRSEEDWEITFNFSASPNVTGSFCHSVLVTCP